MLILAFISGGLQLNLGQSRSESLPQNGASFAEILSGDKLHPGKSNSDIVNEFLNSLAENSSASRPEQEYHPTRGVLSGLFNNVTASNSFLFGFLNAINQMAFGDQIGAGIIILAGAGLMFILWLLVDNVLKVGRCRFFLETRSYYKTGISRLLFPYQVKKAGRVAFTMFLKWLYTFFWGFTIIGGFIKGYSYKMIPYILAENPEISHKEAFRLSRQMMQGEKWKAFLLDLSYAGWYILDVFTAGLLNRLFIAPYQEAAYGELYLALRYKAKCREFQDAPVLFDEFLVRDPIDAAYPAERHPLYIERKRKLELDYHRPYTIWSLILLFFTFSMIGWLWEVGLNLISTGEFVNKGTLFGPWLPIYGTGGVLVLVLLKRFADRPWLTYILTVLVCGTVEYVTAWLLWETKHMKYWDYSGYFGNIQGRVCLEGLIVFGIGGCAFIYMLAPFFDELYKGIPKKFTIVICCILLSLFCCDQVYSHFHPNVGKGITDYGTKGPENWNLEEGQVLYGSEETRGILTFGGGKQFEKTGWEE